MFVQIVEVMVEQVLFLLLQVALFNMQVVVVGVHFTRVLQYMALV